MTKDTTWMNEDPIKRARDVNLLGRRQDAVNVLESWARGLCRPLIDNMYIGLEQADVLAYLGSIEELTGRMSRRDIHSCDDTHAGTEVDYYPTDGIDDSNVILKYVEEHVPNSLDNLSRIDVESADISLCEVEDAIVELKKFTDAMIHGVI